MAHKDLSTERRLTKASEAVAMVRAAPRCSRFYLRVRLGEADTDAHIRITGNEAVTLLKTLGDDTIWLQVDDVRGDGPRRLYFWIG